MTHGSINILSIQAQFLKNGFAYLEKLLLRPFLCLCLQQLSFPLSYLLHTEISLATLNASAFSCRERNRLRGPLRRASSELAPTIQQ